MYREPVYGTYCVHLRRVLFFGYHLIRYYNRFYLYTLVPAEIEIGEFLLSSTAPSFIFNPLNVAHSNIPPLWLQTTPGVGEAIPTSPPWERTGPPLSIRIGGAIPARARSTTGWTDRRAKQIINMSGGVTCVHASKITSWTDKAGPQASGKIDKPGQAGQMRIDRMTGCLEKASIG